MYELTEFKCDAIEQVITAIFRCPIGTGGLLPQALRLRRI
jgi:hypothetical protein